MSDAPTTGRTRSRAVRRSVMAVLAIAFAALAGFVAHLLLPRNVAASGEMLPLALDGGPFEVPYFNGPASPRGIVILGTGDGGWSYWEENTARHLAADGFAVGGWDCRKFADSRKFVQALLGAGFDAAVAAVRARSGAHDDVPIWYAGWSTGAEQSVAAAALANRPRRLVGLLLAAPGTHGRYGITTSDLLGIDPTGPDTFALADMAPKLDGLAVVQYAAGLDPMDDVNWIERVPSPHRIIDLPGKLHDMGGAGPDFLRALDEGIAWTLATKH